MVAIGEAAQRSGVGIETIRYYEREGIVPKPPRAANGRRDYPDALIANLRFIKRCRDLGFPLREAKGLLALSQGDQVNCQDVQNIGHAQLGEVRTKIAELKMLEAALVELTSNCENGSTSCPMLDRLRSAD